MSALEMQSLMARLYVDKYCRELFRRTPEILLDDFDLTSRERKALASIEVDKIDVHAMSMVKQRKRRLTHHFPLLFALSTEPETSCVLHQLFERFHSLHPPVAEMDDAVEVDIFGIFLRQSLRGNDRLPDYAEEIAHYEHVRYQAARGEEATPRSLTGPVADDDVLAFLPGNHVATFTTDVTALAAGIRDGSPPAHAPHAETTVILQNRDGQLRTLAPSGPTAVLMQHINGARSVAQLVDETERHIGAEGLRLSIHGVIERLEERAVVCRLP